MIDDQELSARLAAFAGAALPEELAPGSAGVRAQIAGRRPPRPASAAVMALSVLLAGFIGFGGAMLPSSPARAAEPALQPALDLAPSTLLDPH